MQRSRLLALAMSASMLLPAAGPAAAAEVYRWTDDQGVTHYGQHPPAEHAAERIEAGSRPADDPAQRKAETRRLLREHKVKSYKRRFEREADAKARQRAQQREAFCNRLRSKREKLASIPLVREQTEDGPRMMSQAEREATAEEYDRRIGKHCQDV